MQARRKTTSIFLSSKEKVLKELEDAKRRDLVFCGEEGYKPIFLTEEEISALIRAVVNYYR